MSSELNFLRNSNSEGESGNKFATSTPSKITIKMAQKFIPDLVGKSTNDSFMYGERLWLSHLHDQGCEFESP